MSMVAEGAAGAVGAMGALCPTSPVLWCPRDICPYLRAARQDLLPGLGPPPLLTLASHCHSCLPLLQGWCGEEVDSSQSPLLGGPWSLPLGGPQQWGWVESPAGEGAVQLGTKGQTERGSNVEMGLEWCHAPWSWQEPGAGSNSSRGCRPGPPCGLGCREQAGVLPSLGAAITAQL